MKRLLRGVINFEDGKISEENLAVNYQRLLASGLEWARPEDEKIFGFVKAFFENNLELPTAQTILDYFTRADDIEVQERIGDIRAAEVYARTNFAHLLKQLGEDQNRVKMLALIKEVSEITSKGITIQQGREKKKLQGVKDAAIYFASHVNDLIPPEHSTQTRGDIRRDTKAAWDEYVTAKHNKDKVWGKFTGIEEIDKVCHGLKRGEMWVHAAFAGELKSMFAMNWCYNLVTRYRTNAFYCSFEMPYEQLRRMILVRHSANPRFSSQGKKPLDYRKVRDGELTVEEEAFYQEVLQDWDQNPEYCRFHIWCPDRDVSISDVRIEAELLHKQMEVGFLVLDHGGLMESSRKHRDYTIELNSILREAKKLALFFNHGEGIPVLMLFQINRDGKDAADKADGKYKIRALSYANECLAEGTLVSTSSGLVPIEEVGPDMDVYSSTGWKKVKRRFEQGTRHTMVVRTSEGFEVVCTPEHLFQTIGENGLEWVQAKDLQGRYVLSDLYGTRNEVPPLRPLPALEFRKYEKPNGEAGKALRVPGCLTPRLAYLMGAHDGDGIKADAYRVGWTGNRTESAVRDKIQRYFETTFGHNLPRNECPSRPGSFDLVKWSKSACVTTQTDCSIRRDLHRWFESVGMDREPSVSPYILGAGADQQASYLRGLWDTDGSINNQGILTLGLKRGNRALLQQVQLVMYGLGIPCSLFDGETRLKGKTHHRTVLNVLTLEGKRRFLQVLGGFTEPAKQERLKEACGGPSHDKTVWPFGPLYLRLYERYKARGVFPRKCRVAASKIRQGHRSHVTQAAVETFLECLGPDAVGDEDVKMLRRLLRCRPQQVVTITDGPEVPVFDLEVSGDHEYSTGGILTHNCERSADTITTTYLNDNHRENGTSMCCCLKNRDNPHFKPFLLGVDFDCRRIYRLSPDSLAGNDLGTDGQDDVLNAIMSEI